MKSKKLNKRKVPDLIIDDSLAKYKDMPIFQDKVDKTNDLVRRAGLPGSNPEKPQH